MAECVLIGILFTLVSSKFLRDICVQAQIHIRYGKKNEWILFLSPFSYVTVGWQFAAYFFNWDLPIHTYTKYKINISFGAHVIASVSFAGIMSVFEYDKSSNNLCAKVYFTTVPFKNSWWTDGHMDIYY